MIGAEPDACIGDEADWFRSRNRAIAYRRPRIAERCDGNAVEKRAVRPQAHDPLELDRYSTIQQLTRAFAESVSDVGSIEGLLENLTREAQNLLLQQSRVVTELQNGLMRTRMVPFQRHEQRLSRLVRQVAKDGTGVYKMIDDPRITRVGRFLRRSSLDELPQLWSVLVGDMSLVGPRPALFNQDDLVALRTAAGVARLRPGVTGWAQVNGRDELPIPEKVRLDAEYLERRSFAFDLKILLATARAALTARGVSH